MPKTANNLILNNICDIIKIGDPKREIPGQEAPLPKDVRKLSVSSDLPHL
jgi:hypothetical protein